MSMTMTVVPPRSQVSESGFGGNGVCVWAYTVYYLPFRLVAVLRRRGWLGGLFLLLSLAELGRLLFLARPFSLPDACDLNEDVYDRLRLCRRGCVIVPQGCLEVGANP